MSKRILPISIPILFIILALWCAIQGALTLSTDLSGLSFASTLALSIVNAVHHEREMRAIYAEKQERDTVYLERIAEIMGSRSTR